MAKSKSTESKDAPAAVPVAEEAKPVKEQAKKKAGGRQGEKLFPVEDLAVAKDVKAWEVAGLMRAAGWAVGKQITEEDFDTALAAFRNRPQGSGKIAM